MGPESPWSRVLSHTRAAITYRFSLRTDQADFAAIDHSIREGVEFRGTNVWALIAAIFIASIGLNVNSTAVVIGAMLVSPLMGPIMGIGYAIAMNDFKLIRESFRALFIAVSISIVTSTLYFSLSPLAQAHSELLARTTPTVWDVLIGFFGGLAGAIGVTRREKSNVIPGVAIATALMPPLCTAGFGLATRHAEYFFGAFYLFCINSVFIAIATAIVIGWIGHPQIQSADPRTRRRVRAMTYTLTVLTLLPAFYLTSRMVRNEAYRANAIRFVDVELALPDVHVADRRIMPEEHRIEVALLGDRVPAKTIAALQRLLPAYGLEGTKLVMNQIGDKRVGVASERSAANSELLKGTQTALTTEEAHIAELKALTLKRETATQARVAALSARVDANSAAAAAQVRHVSAEEDAREEALLGAFVAEFPTVREASTRTERRFVSGTSGSSRVLILRIVTKPESAAGEHARMRAWLDTQAPGTQLEVQVEPRRREAPRSPPDAKLPPVR